jgi:hypothetical protein
MSLSLVRPYFRAQMNNLLFIEHDDGFNVANIPSTVLDRAYHISSPSISLVKQNQELIELEAETVIRFFLKGYRNPAEAIDNAMDEEQNILMAVLSAANRTTSEIKNVVFAGSTKEQLADSNDDSVLVTMTFNVLVLFCPN